jgi:hypothetical protein
VQAALFAATLLLAVVIGGTAGAVTADPSILPYQSEAQAEILASTGPPDQWLLADGPIKPGGEVHRIETWIHQDAAGSRYYKWLDGVLLEQGTLSAPARERDPALPAPNQLHRGMDIDAALEVLGEEPLYVTFPDAPFELSLAYLFEESQLVLTFFEDRLLTAQTW